jgi:hypothetical protein
VDQSRVVRAIHEITRNNSKDGPFSVGWCDFVDRSPVFQQPVSLLLSTS